MPEPPHADTIPSVAFGIIVEKTEDNELTCEQICELATWFRAWGNQQQIATYCGMAQVKVCECEACETEG